MKTVNIYMTGVGGQGIGLLSEAIVRAADYAGFHVKGVDTHGLAQRGGIVVSHARIGKTVYSPLIPEGEADIAIALERHEALRAMNAFLKDGGTLIYYDTVWQPLEVRLGQTPEISAEIISAECRKRQIREFRVTNADLADVRMQNMALLAHIAKHAVIPDVTAEHYQKAMADLMTGKMLESNLAMFEAYRQS